MNGLVDESEMSQAYDFWSAEDQSEQHQLLGEMCFANMQAMSKRKRDEMNRGQEEGRDGGPGGRGRNL
jgi:hypothetical protein